MLRMVEEAMRTWVALAIAVWLLCGLAGAWVLGLNRPGFLIIAKGPVLLVEAMEKNPSR